MDIELENNKKCSKCKEAKGLSEFYSRKARSKKLGEYIYYHPECKECAKNRSRKYQLDNHEEYKQYHKEYRKRRNDYMTEKSRRWNRENKEFMQQYMKEYYKKNPDKFKIYNEKRGHKNHEITENEWDSCKQYFNYCCAYCGIDEQEAKETQGNVLHKEHVDHEGANDLSNCIPSCKQCNSYKWQYDFDDWYSELNPAYTKERYERIMDWLKEDFKAFYKIQ